MNILKRDLAGSAAGTGGVGEAAAIGSAPAKALNLDLVFVFRVGTFALIPSSFKK